MAHIPPAPFLRGRSAGGYMSPKTREDRCQATTARELTKLTASKKFQYWLCQKSSSSVLWWSRLWATAFFVLLVLLAATVSHFQHQMSVLSSDLANARGRFPDLQGRTVNSVGRSADEQKLEGQVKRGQQENVKLLAEIQTTKKENAALQLSVQNLRSQVHGLETQEMKLREEADRLAKGLKQEELENGKKVKDMEIRENQLREEVDQLSQGLERQRHEHNKMLHDMEAQAAELKREADAHACDGDHRATETAQQVAAIRKFYLWVSWTIALLAAYSSGKMLQQKWQLARACGSTIADASSSKSGDPSLKEGLLFGIPAALKRSRGLGVVPKNNSKHCNTKEVGIQASMKQANCEMLEADAQTDLSDLSMIRPLEAELDKARQENEAIKKKLEEIEALDSENRELKEKEDKYVQSLSLNYALKSRKSITGQMESPEDSQGSEPFYDDDFCFSPHTSVGLNGSTETSTNLFNEALATLERFGTASCEDSQNGGMDHDNGGDERLPSHQIRDKALHVLLENGSASSS